MNLVTGEDDRIDKVLGKLHKAFESQTKFTFSISILRALRFLKL